MAGRGEAQGIVLQPLATGLPNPLGIANAGDGSGRLFIVLQGGQILIHDGATVLPDEFLDITGLVTCCGERGLLGLAFHPDYASNGYFYVNYINTGGSTVIARYTAAPPNSNVADPTSAKIILTIAQPSFTNHKGGQLQFGSDGYLYIATGDGGGAGDPNNRAQTLGDPLGKLLRIDVNVPEDGPAYAVPPTNPFVDTPGARPEIWALGLRNPWRFTFDRLTGDLFIADVGQNVREEVNYQPAGSAGGQNYGWRLMEGSLCFNPSTNCDDGDPVLTLPVLEYDHSLGCSITGGYRYRGTQMPSLTGAYFYADFCSGRIWGGTQTGPTSFTTTLLLDTALNISTFGEDEAGELYLTHLDETNGAVYRIVAPADGEIIIDNGTPGTSFTGSWCVSSGTGSFGSNSL
ncbi:MAG: PQQ-dependent sugar dehydrogenase, partial [Candidatus Rokubacteria bacterium]|nr:PQQ-dependent sugar dehydrogenase [Candidatus Rokubacteria bacterium]